MLPMQGVWLPSQRTKIPPASQHSQKVLFSKRKSKMEKIKTMFKLHSCVSKQSYTARWHHILWHSIKIIRHVKKHENMTHNRRNTSIKTDQEVIQMLELAEKDTKAVTAVVHTLYMLRDIENIEKTKGNF